MNKDIIKENRNFIDTQIKNKIKNYNRQRIGAAIVTITIMAFLLLSPVAESKASSIRLVILCSFILYFLAVIVVLSSLQAFLLFLAATVTMTCLLALNQIHLELFLTVTMIHAGAVLISQKIADVFIEAAINEIEILQRLKMEANMDSLTQLLNRSGMEQALATAWAFCKRDKKHAGFLMVDIDYFKSYNDTLGHLEGDKILQQVADCIKVCCKRKTDIISRIGGEEFLIFLSDVDDEQILYMAHTLSAAVTDLKIKTASESNPCDFLSVSIGIATGIPQAHDLTSDFYKQADKALYHAKRSGRNCISFNGNIIEPQ